MTARVPRAFRAALEPLDAWSLVYACFAVAVIAVRWPWPWPQAWPVVLPHAVLAALALLAPHLRRGGPTGAFVGAFYALGATLGLYSSIGLLNRAAGVVHDARVSAWEQMLFAGQPACDWIRAQPWPWLSATLHAAYFSYYFILAGTPLALWMSGRRAAARRTLLHMMLAFYVCYAVFLVFPVSGPHHAFELPRGPAKDVLPARVVELLIARGDAWGTAFPSSHVAVALAAAVGAWRGWRALGVVVVPLALLLALGTVYGQFHYVVDALAGAMVAAATAGVGRARDGADADDARNGYHGPAAGWGDAHAVTAASRSFMPRLTARLLALASAVALAAAPARAAEEVVDRATLQRVFEEGLQRSQVMDTLAYLTDVIGARLTGSPQLETASEWARARLAGWGLAEARIERYPFGPGWSLQHTALRMLAPETVPLVAWPRAWTPGTDGPVRGHAIAARIESEADLETWRGKLGGRVALLSPAAEIKGRSEPLLHRLTDTELDELERLTIPKGEGDRLGRFQKRRRFAAALHRFLAEERPLAAIQVSPHEAGVIEVGGSGLRGLDDPRGVPQLVLAAEQYNRLLRLLERGIDVELELEVRATFHEQELTAPNVIAEIPGEGPKKDEVVMLGAHLDSWHAGTGATDNAAGSAVVMEAVRILRAVGARPRRTIRVALWSGEEQGLLGSRAYVAEHFALRPEATPDEPQRGPLKLLPEHARLAAYFNIDSGTGRVRGVLAQENLAALPMLAAWIEPLRVLGVTTVSPQRDFGSDHMSFDRAGLPAFNMLQDDIEYETLTHHTHLDVLDRIQRDDVVQASVVLASLVWQAAQREAMPPRKPIPAPSPAAVAPAGSGK